MRLLLFLMASSALVASVAAPDPLSEKVKGYKKWFCVTPVAVDMEPRVAVLCSGPRQWDSSPYNPHFPTLFKVYVNPVGKAAMLSRGKMPFPVGSVVLKEKYQQTDGSRKARWDARVLKKDAKPVLLTVMIKREKGFAPADGDWQYMVLSGGATKETTAGLEHCADCHREQKAQDYVFRSYPGATDSWVRAVKR